MIIKKPTRKDASILLIGTSGLVGSCVYSQLQRKRLYILNPSHEDIDITHGESFISYIKEVKPSVIVNFAALSSIDVLEKERGDLHGQAWKLNVMGVKNILKCLPLASFFIHISTDAVFSGINSSPGPYREQDPVCRDDEYMNWYGITKREAERIIQSSTQSNWAIIRISYPFGNPNSSRDLLKKAIHDLDSKRPIFADQIFTPTYIPDLSDAIQIIVRKKLRGIFHVACQPAIKRIEFTHYVMEKMKIKKTLLKGSMENFIRSGQIAPRTRLGGLNTTKTEKELNIHFHQWDKAINQCIKQYEEID